MKNFRRSVIALTTAVLLGTLTACAGNDKTSENTAVNNTDSKDDKLSIVCTIFPEYDWVKELTAGNDNVEITMLLDNGVDLHSYQPTADDIIKISTCDMFVYVGGESDEWVEDALAESVNKDMEVVNLLDVLGDSVKEEEVKEGMEAEEDEEEESEEEEGPEYDEHVWLSLRNTDTVCGYIAEKLGTIDADNKAVYEKNYSTYSEKLNALDKQYSDAVSAASVKTLLFGDRFPFRYMTDDYGLDYYAAFVGCSAETEASFETIAFLAKKTDELSLNSVMTIEGADHRIAETIAQNTESGSKDILTLDSMQSTTSEDVKNGTTYLSVMESNLEVLRQALK